jgi:large subunit ribosomal protein L25
VTSERVKLVVSERTKLGSAESRRLRRQGIVPGVLYGRSTPVAISVRERDLRPALTTAAGSHAVLDVVIDGGRAHSAILKDYQRDPIRGTITHVDLQEVRLDQPIHAAVAITLVGEAAGAKEGGVVSHVATEVHVEALPLEVPQHVEADVSELHVGGSLRVADLRVPAGVTVLDDPDTVVATVTAPTRVEEAGAEETGAEAAAESGATAAEGGEAAEPAGE